MYRLNCYKDDSDRSFNVSICNIANNNDTIIDGMVFDNVDAMKKVSYETDKASEMLHKATKNI